MLRWTSLHRDPIDRDPRRARARHQAIGRLGSLPQLRRSERLPVRTLIASFVRDLARPPLRTSFSMIRPFSVERRICWVRGRGHCVYAGIERRSRGDLRLPFRGASARSQWLRGLLIRSRLPYLTWLRSLRGARGPRPLRCVGSRHETRLGLYPSRRDRREEVGDRWRDEHSLEVQDT